MQLGTLPVRHSPARYGLSRPRPTRPNGAPPPSTAEPASVSLLGAGQVPIHGKTYDFAKIRRCSQSTRAPFPLIPAFFCAAGSG